MSAQRVIANAMRKSAVDVLIIGGGPTGVSLGLELAAQGVSFRIVDRARGRSDKSRALVVQPRTLELLNRHRLGIGNHSKTNDSKNVGGIARRLQARGNTAGTSVMCVNRKVVAEIKVKEVGRLPNTAFPFQLLISQEDTEYFLDEALAGYGKDMKVEWGVEAKSFSQDEEGVTVTFGDPVARKREAGTQEEVKEKVTETVRAKYVVGCDGKHSAVRQAAGMTFGGDSYEHDFVLVDVHVDWDGANNNNKAYQCLGQGFMVVLPIGRGLVRIVTMRNGVAAAGSEVPGLEDFQRIFDQMMPRGEGGRLRDPTWLARFYLHHRGVDRYSRGRLFVAGDAAHVHSPAGGQGMNTGIQDVVNLGWKLGAVLRGERPVGLLDSYNAERWPVGQQLLKTTDRRFSWITWMNPVYLFLRNLLLPWLAPLVMRNKALVRREFHHMAEFDITYRGSPIVGTAPGLPAACTVHGGDRVIDGKLRAPNDEESWLLDLVDLKSHHLVLFSGAGPDAATEAVLRHARAAFAERSPIAAKVHMVLGEKTGQDEGYLDVDGTLHRELGFQQAAYILIRPDGYAAHVGPLTALDDLVNWLK